MSTWQTQAERTDFYGQRLAAMVRIPTISREPGQDLTEFNRLQALLADFFPHYHGVAEKTVVDGSLLFRWPGENPALPGILLMAHQDVVPADAEGWLVPPFAGEIVDGKLYGRGSLDCKATLFSLLQAQDELAAEDFVPPCDVYVVSACNEESSAAGATAIAAMLAERGVRFDYVLDEGGTVTTDGFPGLKRPMAFIGLTEKGIINVEIAAPHPGGHASRPPKDSGIARLAEFVRRMEKKKPLGWQMMPVVKAYLEAVAPELPPQERFLFSNLWLTKPLLPRLLPRMSSGGEALLATTCAFTMAGGSSAHNVLPRRAWLNANIRLAPFQTVEEVMDILRRTAKGLDLEISYKSLCVQCPVTSMEGAPYKRMAETFRQVFPDAGVAPFIMLAGTDSRMFSDLTDNILRIMPIRQTPEQLTTWHGVNENLDIAGLPECVDFYKTLLHNQPRSS